LVELLVVIAIIGVLVALLLPAIQAARESARRTQCSNHLRQLGIACHMFVDARGVIPPSRAATSGFPPLGTPAGAYQGWAVWLLPYIEQANLASTYDTTLHFGHAKNRQAVQTQIKLFYCPSTPNQKRISPDFTHSSFTISGAACTDYSVTRWVEQVLWTSFPNDVDNYGVHDPVTGQNMGPYSYNTGSSIRIMRWPSVTDGLSNTIFYTEDAGRPQAFVSGWNKLGSTTWGGSAWCDESNEFGLHGCTPSTSADIRPGKTAFGCTNNGEPYAFHASGINEGMCDGSVRFISASIAVRTFARLITAQAGDLVSDF